MRSLGQFARAEELRTMLQEIDIDGKHFLPRPKYFPLYFRTVVTARYSINPDVSRKRGKSEMHRLPRNPPSDVVLIENFPLIFNDPARENETGASGNTERGQDSLKFVTSFPTTWLNSLGARSNWMRRVSLCTLLLCSPCFTNLDGRHTDQWKKAISGFLELVDNYVTLLRPIRATDLNFPELFSSV